MALGPHPSEGDPAFEAGRKAAKVNERETTPVIMVPRQAPAPTLPETPEIPRPIVITDSPGTRGRTSENKGDGNHGK